MKVGKQVLDSFLARCQVALQMRSHHRDLAVGAIVAQRVLDRRELVQAKLGECGADPLDLARGDEFGDVELAFGDIVGQVACDGAGLQ